MGRRSVRISLFLFALLASAGLGYRIFDDESRLAAARQQGAALEMAAEEALAHLLDVRSSLHVYVAPGQGTEFWSARVLTQLDGLRQRLMTLDAAVAGTGGSLAESLDAIDQLAAAERRARQYADRGETLLAGDVLFTEVRDLLNAVTEQVGTVRYTLRSQAETQVAGIRQQQAALVAAAVGVWLIVSLLLLPGGAKPSVQQPGEWRQELADTLKKSAPAPESSEELRRDLTDLSAGASAKVEAAVGGEGGPVPEPVTIVAPAAPIDLTTVAEICADLSALTDPGALAGALARTSDVLGAKGLIVWVSSSDGATLSAVSTHGYEPRVVERIGTVERASANLTAEALRENAPRISAATATAGAALAVPMGGPTGPVGVLSVELRQGFAADEARVAIASILAAQLATLTAPLPAVTTEAGSADEDAVKSAVS